MARRKGKRYRRKFRVYVRGVTRGVGDWSRALVKRHLLAAVKHPHHYTTAAVLSVLCFALGHVVYAELSMAWLYAFVETVVSGTPNA